MYLLSTMNMIAIFIIISNSILLVNCFDLSILSYGRYMDVQQKLAVFDGIGIHACSRVCGTLTECKSFSFHIFDFKCYLYQTDAIQTPNALLSSPGYFYGERDIVIKDATLMGSCVNHACPDHSTCVELRSQQAVCVVSDCGVPPAKTGAIAVTNIYRPVGNTYTYSCKSEYTLVGGSGTIQCLSTGQWSIPSFTCKEDDD